MLLLQPLLLPSRLSWFPGTSSEDRGAHLDAAIVALTVAALKSSSGSSPVGESFRCNTLEGLLCGDGIVPCCSAATAASAVSSLSSSTAVKHAQRQNLSSSADQTSRRTLKSLQKCFNPRKTTAGREAGHVQGVGVGVGGGRDGDVDAEGIKSCLLLCFREVTGATHPCHYLRTEGVSGHVSIIRVPPVLLVSSS